MIAQTVILQALTPGVVYRVADVKAETGYSRDTVARAPQRLARNGVVEEFSGDGRGRQRLYQTRQQHLFAVNPLRDVGRVAQ